MQKALNQCYLDAKLLKNRFENLLKGFQVKNWTDFVEGDANYQNYKVKLLELYHNNTDFKAKLRLDAERVFRKKEIADQSTFLHNFEQDLLEHCMYYFLATHNGYRFEFYPGQTYEAVDFMQNYFLDDRQKLIRINVSLHTPKWI